MLTRLSGRKGRARQPPRHLINCRTFAEVFMIAHEACCIDDCNKPIKFKKDQLCQMHYFRRMRNGHFGLKQRKPSGVKNTNYRYVRSDGYVLIRRENCPISMKSGFIFEHRFVMYEIHGDNLPDCQLCGNPSDWFSRKTHIDHIDEIRSNNSPENLRVLCNSCNVTRTKKAYHSQHNCTSITIGDLTLTANEWSRQPGVSVSGSAIKDRLRRGFSDYEAVYSYKKTHNGNIPKKPETPPKHTRKNSISLTIDGVTKTSAEWSRDDFCRVSEATIRMRKKKGIDDYSCVFGVPISGPNAKRYKP